MDRQPDSTKPGSLMPAMNLNDQKCRIDGVPFNAALNRMRCNKSWLTRHNQLTAHSTEARLRARGTFLEVVHELVGHGGP